MVMDLQLLLEMRRLVKHWAAPNFLIRKFKVGISPLAPSYKLAKKKQVLKLGLIPEANRI
jgi:hypothetical protein